MFDTLSDRLGSVFDRLRGRGALSEADVRAAMREVRVALLEADVALPVARDFVEQVTEKAVIAMWANFIRNRPLLFSCEKFYALCASAGDGSSAGGS